MILEGKLFVLLPKNFLPNMIDDRNFNLCMWILSHQENQSFFLYNHLLKVTKPFWKLIGDIAPVLLTIPCGKVVISSLSDQ